MRLARMTDYAVVVLAQMARESGGAVFTAAYLAAATGLPRPSVAKLLKNLAGQGIVRAQRGAAGGYGLARPAEAISLAEVVDALEGPVALTACSGGSACDYQASCPAHGHWDPINQAMRGALAAVSLAALGAPPPRGH